MCLSLAVCGLRWKQQVMCCVLARNFGVVGLACCLIVPGTTEHLLQENGMRRARGRGFPSLLPVVTTGPGVPVSVPSLT